MSAIAERLTAVRARIARACTEAGRDPGSVRLVAVSKFHSVEALREAHAAGQRDFGENYAQELADKARALGDLPDLRLRFIGALQRNKVRLLVETGCAIETLASAATARALSERAVAQSRQLEVMLQVNVSAEPQKSGVSLAELPALIAAVRALPALTLSGLMAIPRADDPAAAAAAYRTLAAQARAHDLPALSMGMSDDLELAIAAGATSVRVGTAIFGPRPAR
jgi:PLP dependent protein